jgi:signal transduction histidine kinase/tetratricopeptide (TPR) repeat protein
MLENLRLAVKGQKRLITIFLVTIFIPTITLSIFGIRAIRNERYRIDKQLENEHRRVAEILKSQIGSLFKDLESSLFSLVQSNAFKQKDEVQINTLLNARIADLPLVEHVFVAFAEEEPWFPFFQPGSHRKSSSFGDPLDQNLPPGLKSAEAFEFQDKNYEKAIRLYNSIAELSGDTQIKAQMFANISRCLMKAKDYTGALKNFRKICEDYPESTSSTGLPFALISRLQMISCLKNLGEFQNVAQSSLDLYRDILSMRWPLEEAQFNTYAILVKESIEKSLAENQQIPPLENFKEVFDGLKRLHQERIGQWSVIKDIEQEVIPELDHQQDSILSPSTAFRYSKTIGVRLFLVSAVQIPANSEKSPSGLLGIKLNDQFLINDAIPGSIETLQFGDTTDVVISDLSGKVLLGKKNLPAEQATITEFFQDNFPPWRIEFFRSKTGTLGGLDIGHNFYLWTILTLIVVLISGSVLISRTIVHEMEVLKLKSDFVYSVSHEFKSPLTSIKALAVRLKDGKVKDSDKMKQYFSLINQDVDRLAYLVRNILDFSKIEEGKREFEFVETDLGQFVTKEMEDLKRDEFTKGINVQVHVAEDLPHLAVDRDALSQALRNLLDNAVKFSPDRKQIDVNLKKDQQNVCIEVMDRGTGIPSHELNRLFDKFYQGRSTIRYSRKGTGLGLTLVKHTIEAHGGRMSVKSQVGKGSTFTIILPIQRKGERGINGQENSDH